MILFIKIALPTALAYWAFQTWAVSRGYSWANKMKTIVGSLLTILMSLYTITLGVFIITGIWSPHVNPDLIGVGMMLGMGMMVLGIGINMGLELFEVGITDRGWFREKDNNSTFKDKFFTWAAFTIQTWVGVGLIIFVASFGLIIFKAIWDLYAHY